MKGVCSISTLCELLGVSPSRYYAVRKGTASARERQDAELAVKIAEAHRRSRGTYGAPRIVAELREQGVAIGRARCARLMKAQGLRGRKKHRRKPRTTDSRDTHAPAPNRLAQQPPPTGPNQTWVTDITCVLTAEGWLYLAAIVDLWSRRVVGWSCSPTMHVSLVLDALRKALALRRPPAGLLHHSDRGSQYAAREYIAALAAAGLVASMSRAGNCYDNAYIESFWSTCKSDTQLDVVVPPTRNDAQLAIFDYIETFYNPTRRHSSLGQISPVAFENIKSRKDTQAA
jgi:transposase InsO family protein